MAKTTEQRALYRLAGGLTVVAARMGPKEAGEAAAAFTQAMSKTPGYLLDLLAPGLSAVAVHLEPKEAGEAAATLTQAMARRKDLLALQRLAEGLSVLSARMEPKEAAALCGQAAATLTQAMARTTNPSDLPLLVQGLTAVAGRLGPKEASEAAATLTQAMARWTDPEWSRHLAKGLTAVLLREDASRGMHQPQGVAGAIGMLSRPESVLVVAVHLQPLPPPLPAQTLVDLLKQPLCVGEARRLVLEQLQRHYRRPFADQWEFVRFAQEHQLGLDLKTPPQRPEPLPANGTR
jgi:hypothetical protein